MNAPQIKQQAAPKAPRMTLAAVTRGIVAQPLRVVIYGSGGVGKSTFGAQAPAPIFLGPEDGSALLDVARFPQPETWGDVLEAVQTLTREEHPYKTLVVDSADWLEPLCWAEVCRAGNKRSIEDFGFGKGYVAALEEWRKFFAAIEGLRKARRMHVVVIAHAEVRAFKNPEGEDYERYQLKLHRAASGLLSEWCDELSFAHFKTHVVKNDPKNKVERAKGYGSDRVLYTERRAAFDAKSRHGLADEMPLSWEEFFAGTQRGSGELAASVRAEIDAALADLQPLDPTTAERALAACEGVTDVGKLSTYLNTIRQRVAERKPAAAEVTTNA